MKALLLAGMAVATIGVIGVFARPSAAQASANSAKAKQESPLACDRLALTPEQRKRHFDELGPILVSLRTEIRELPDGFEFKYPADAKTIQLIAEWAAGERVCCPFFEITLRMEPEGGPLWLRVTGREGVKEFMEVEGKFMAEFKKQKNGK